MSNQHTPRCTQNLKAGNWALSSDVQFDRFIRLKPIPKFGTVIGLGVVGEKSSKSERQSAVCGYCPGANEVGYHPKLPELYHPSRSHGSIRYYLRWHVV